MERCKCDNCDTTIIFKEQVFRNGDIFCSRCSHLYEDEKSIKQMSDITLTEENK